MDDLTTNLRYYLTKIQLNEYKIRNFFSKPQVSYAS